VFQNAYRLLLDKDDHALGVFTYDENGEYTVLLHVFPCATGRSKRMTPLGEFEISSKGEWKRWNSSQYSPFYTKYTSGLYIHGALYRSKRGDTLRKGSYEDIGTNATSGCLRTTYEAAKWVYFHCPAGTVIEIVQSSDLIEFPGLVPIDESNPKWDPTDPRKPPAETE